MKEENIIIYVILMSAIAHK